MAEQAGGTIDYFTTAAGIDFLVGELGGFRYAPHLHDTFIVGAVSQGVANLSINGRSYTPRPGQLILCNPYEVHDGSALSDDMSYRASFPSAAFVHGIAAESRWGAGDGPVRFSDSVVDDPIGARLFQQAHQSAQRGDCVLEAEERLITTYAYCLARHAQVAFAEAGSEQGPVHRAKALLCDNYASTVTLSDLVDEAGIPRQRLITAFRHRTGLTPHAFLISQRIIAAKALLRGGQSGADVAARTGFSDQPHLTRTFKTHLGITPGAYQRAVRGR